MKLYIPKRYPLNPQDRFDFRNRKISRGTLVLLVAKQKEYAVVGRYQDLKKWDLGRKQLVLMPGVYHLSGKEAYQSSLGLSLPKLNISLPNISIGLDNRCRLTDFETSYHEHWRAYVGRQEVMQGLDSEDWLKPYKAFAEEAAKTGKK